MTAMPAAPTIATEPIPPGYWRREVSHAPRPQSPLCRTTALVYTNAGFRRMFDELGVLPETLQWREIRGWIYTRLAPPGRADRAKAAAETVRTDRYGRYLDRWFGSWRHELAATIAELRAVPLTALDDGELTTHLHRVLALLEHGIDVHFRLQGGYAALLADLAFTCRDLLGWDDQDTLTLLHGLCTASTEPARRLAELATLARSRPAVRALVRRADAAAAAALAQADPEFAAEFAAYQREFGFRAIRYEVIDPTIAETPEVPLRLLRDLLASDTRPVRDTASGPRGQRREQARAALSGVDLARFDRALARAERIYPVREEYGPATFNEPLALLRHTALEVGRRLVAAGRLIRAEDAFFLEGAELLAALTRVGPDLAAVVATRRANREWALANPGPASYGTEPEPPASPRALATEAQLANRAMTWLVRHSFAPEDSARVQSGPVLTGTPASAGSYTGPVRVIHEEAEFGQLRPGDVLVCPTTSPVWSILFASVGALVTDGGGLLSHPAIIAREHGIPAVVGTGNATSVLRTGVRVTVDGSGGAVRAMAPNPLA
jgi:pyruvate,water dikinase